jgi:hypothetical protein
MEMPYVLVQGCLEEATLLPAAAGAALLEQAEGALARLVALAGQELQGLLAGHHLAAADDATMLVLDEVLLLETTGRVLGSTVENLGLGTSCDHLGHLIHWAAIFWLCTGGDLSKRGSELY